MSTIYTYLRPATPWTIRSSLVKVPVLSKQHTSTLPANGILKGSVQYTPTEKQVTTELICYERPRSLQGRKVVISNEKELKFGIILTG